MDGPGHPLKFRLASGAAGDNPHAIPPLEGRQASEVRADRGYAAAATSAYVEEQMQARATISPRPCDYAADKERHPVECFSGKRTHPRRVFARVDKYARRSLASGHLASTSSWPR